MSTGYTAAIGEGIGFPEFVLRYARVRMRDESLDAPTPAESKPSPWHKQELAKARRKLNRIKRLMATPEKALKWATRSAQRRYEQQLREIRASQARMEKLREQYQAMLTKVQDWTPPTSDHQGLKDGMIREIEESIDHDCFEIYAPKLLTPGAYIRQTLKSLMRLVDYHSREWKNEVEHAKQKNAWVKALFEDLYPSSQPQS